MKRMMLLPALGAAAALTWGAASQLNVSSTAPIQVGQSGGTWCADSASIAGWGYNDLDGSVEYAWVDVTTPDEAGAACDGRVLYVTPLDGAGTMLALNDGRTYSTGKTVMGESGDNRVDNVTRYKVEFGTNNTPPTPGTVSASALESARISIDQGPQVTGDPSTH